MATPKRTSASCPYCSWKTGRSYNMPHHIITRHTEEVSVSSMMGHCVSCHDKKKEISFYVCLTCHGGTLSDCSTKQGLEWVTKHSKNTECKKAHTQLYQELKKNLSESTLPICQETSHTPSPIPSTPHQPTNTIESLWEKFKTDRRMTQFMIKLEEQCDPVSYDDSDDDNTSVEYTFTAKDGFEMAIITGMENKKDIDKLKGKVNELEKEIEAIKIEQYNQNLQYQKMIFDLQTSLKREQRNSEDYKRSLYDSEKELLRYRKHYPSPPEEI